MKSAVPSSGRQSQAALNDRRIWAAARAVFAADPSAPISAVAKHAGVGSSALYLRYASKEALLQMLALDALLRYIAVAEAGTASEDDPWESFAFFLRGVVDSDIHALMHGLMGRISLTEELSAAVRKAQELSTVLFERAKAAGVIRADLSVNDVSGIFDQLASVRPDGDVRAAHLRHRYLTLHMDALRTLKPSPLPDPAP